MGVVGVCPINYAGLGVISEGSWAKLNCSTWKRLADWDTCTEFRVKRDGIKLVSVKSGRQMKIWKVNWNWSQDEEVLNILKALKRSFSSTPIWNLPFRTRMNVSATHQKKQEENKHRGHVPDLEHESIWTGKHTAPRQQCHYLRSHCLPVSSFTTKSCRQVWRAISYLQNKHLKQLPTNQITHPARKASINVATLDTVSVAEGH